MPWNAKDPLFEGCQPARAEIVDKIRQQFSWVEESYWSFITEVGFGEFGGLHFYEGVVSLEDLGLSQGPPEFVAFADDGAGYFYGFHPQHHFSVVGIDSTGWLPEDLGQSFEQFVESLRART